MNTKYAIIAALAVVGLLTGCGTKESDFGRFAAYVYAYDNEAALRGAKTDLDGMIVRFQTSKDLELEKNLDSRPDESTLAYCVRGGWDGWAKAIVVIPSQWNSLVITDYYREVVLFHELGHCVNNMSHANDMPRIMNPYLNTGVSRASGGPDGGRVLGVIDYQASRGAFLDRHFQAADRR